MAHEPDVHRRDNENGISEGPFEDVIQIHDNEDPCEDAELDDDYDRELDEFNHGMVRVWDEDSDNDDEVKCTQISQDLSSRPYNLQVRDDVEEGNSPRCRIGGALF